MPACATQETVADPPTIGNLFFPVPDTDFRDFLDEVDPLARFAPEIITAIEATMPGTLVCDIGLPAFTHAPHHSQPDKEQSPLEGRLPRRPQRCKSPRACSVCNNPATTEILITAFHQASAGVEPGPPILGTAAFRGF